MPRRRFLLVSHEASRTGAVRVALDILRGIPTTAFEKVAVIKLDGPLTGEFRDIADRVILEPGRTVRPWIDRLRFHGFLGAAAIAEQVLAGLVIGRVKPDVVYANSVIAADYIRPSILLGIPAVLHLHELEPAAAPLVRRYGLERIAKKCRVVGCSAAVQQDSSQLLGIGCDEVRVIYEPVDVGKVQRLACENMVQRGESGMTHATVVGACGTVGEHKGPDLWLDVARKVRGLRPEIAVKFVWIGSGPGLEEMSGETARLGLAGAVEFYGEHSNPFPALAGVDVFTIPSRYDSFPLVGLEAMALEKPIVAFDVGGLREQIGECGILVPPGDTDAMARAIMSLVENPALRTDLGTRGRERVERLFDIAHFRRRMSRLLQEVCCGRLGNSAVSVADER
jgi:glycosyltransferase involved in cell wall biosynthesis